MKKDVISIINENSKDIRFLLDSGAFTAWKAGKEIKLDDYCSFIESLPFKPWRYFTLDVIGDPEKSFENYNKMLERGFEPIPIFTRGEDISMIDEYYKTSDVLGIGGLVGTKGNKGFVKGIMNKIGNRKVHWLGFTNQSYILKYKPYMCDSSSFDSGVRFGHVHLYDKAGRFVKIKKTDMRKRPSSELFKLVRFYEEDPESLSFKSNWINTGADKTTMERLIYKSAVRYNRDLCKKTGSHVFFACGTKHKVRSLLRFYEWRNK